MIDRCAIRVLSSAHRCARSRSQSATCRASSGCSMRSTSAQPSAAIKFDIDAMWISATSSAIPRSLTSSGSSAHASTIRSNSEPSSSESRCCRTSSMTATTSSSAARSARLPEAAIAAMASGCTKASEPSSVSKATTSRSNAAPYAAPAPAHDASPIRWPSRRVRSNRSTDPSSPSSVTVWSSARSRFARYDVTSSRHSPLGRVRRSVKISSGSFRRNIR